MENNPVKYKRGFCRLFFEEYSTELYASLKQYAIQCEEFIIGTVNEEAYARLIKKDGLYNRVSNVAEIWKDVPWVKDVVELSVEELYISKAFEKLEFDLFICGTDVGRYSKREAEFCEINNIDYKIVLPTASPLTNSDVCPDSFEMMLDNILPGQKIVLYGTGAYFDIFMDKYGDRYKPAYAVDGNKDKWGTSKRGIMIVSPDTMGEEAKDDIFVIFCAKNYKSMKEKLLSYKAFDYRPMVFTNSLSVMDEAAIKFYEEKDYLRRSQDSLGKMFGEFDRVCTTHNIKYYLSGGSLIGAIREGGFIPWDDDMDVTMTRSEFNRFVKVAQSEWGEDSNYIVLPFEDSGKYFTDVMTRVYDLSSETSAKADVHPDGISSKKKKFQAPKQPWTKKNCIDIFILDNAFDDEKKHLRQMTKLKVLYTLMMGHRFGIEYSDYKRKRMSPFNIFLIWCANTLGRMLPYEFLKKKFIHVRELANNQETSRYYISSWAITTVEHTFKKNFFGEGSRVKFEQYMASIPDDPAGYLSASDYNSYMTPPPYSKRAPLHHISYNG